MFPSLLNYWHCSKPPEAWDTNDSLASSGNFLWSLVSFLNPSCRNQEITSLSQFITIKNKCVISGPRYTSNMPETMSWNQSQSSVSRRQYKNQKSLFKKNNPWFEANLVIFGAWFMTLNAWSGQWADIAKAQANTCCFPVDWNKQTISFD